MLLRQFLSFLFGLEQEQRNFVAVVCLLDACGLLLASQVFSSGVSLIFSGKFWDHFFSLSLSLSLCFPFPIASGFVDSENILVQFSVLFLSNCLESCGLGWVAMEERYEAMKELGSGNFGVARLVRDKKTKELVAVKYIERGKKVFLFLIW